ncbi:PAS domain-containing protein, partial [Chloroflexota bacterium]
MSNDRLNIGIGSAHERLARLSQRAVDLPPPHRDLVDEVLAAFSASMEEIRVGAEELVQQNQELLAAHEDLEAECRRYRGLCEFAPDGFLVTDPAGLIREANQAAVNLLAVPRLELMGQPLDLYVAAGDRKRFHTHVERLLDRYQARTEGIEWEIQIQPQSRTSFPAALTVAPICDAEGELTGLHWLMRDVTATLKAERALQGMAHDLGERVKELNCLYGISSLVEIPGISLEEILQGAIDLIPLAWQHPEVTCARIMLDGQEFSTENFAQSPWQQAADILVHGERCGEVQVGILQERPESDKGPFPKEDRDLLNVIAKRMGEITERMRAQQQVRQQHQYLQTVLDSLRHPFYVINTQDHTVEMANSAAYAGHWHGKRTCFALVHGRDQPCDTVENACPLQEVLRTKEPVVVEHEHMDGDGRRRDMEIRGYPIADPEGNVVQMIEYALDITERKQAELALRESESRWRSLTQTSPDPILMLDTDLTIQFANFASPGLTIDELIGTPLYTLVDEPRQAEIKAILENVLRTGAPARYETVYHSPDRGDIYYESHAAPRGYLRADYAGWAGIQ